jgi:hypothetical protein
MASTLENNTASLSSITRILGIVRAHDKQLDSILALVMEVKTGLDECSKRLHALEETDRKNYSKLRCAQLKLVTTALKKDDTYEGEIEDLTAQVTDVKKRLLENSDKFAMLEKLVLHLARGSKARGVIISDDGNINLASTLRLYGGN